DSRHHLRPANPRSDLPRDRHEYRTGELSSPGRGDTADQGLCARDDKRTGAQERKPHGPRCLTSVGLVDLSEQTWNGLERDGFSSNPHLALLYCWSMIFFRKPVSTFRDSCSSLSTSRNLPGWSNGAEPRLCA